MFRGLYSYCLSKLTATAGTAITALLPPRAGCFTRLIRLLYLASGVDHTLTVLKSLGSTTLSSGAAAAQAHINLLADPGTGTVAGGIASGDFVCVQLDSGEYFLGKVSSVSTLDVTLTSNLPSAAAGGNSVWFFGAPGDHVSSQTLIRPVPLTGSQFTATAATLKDFVDYAGGICQSNHVNEPLLVHSDNTASGSGGPAGTMQQVSFVHTAD